MYFNLFHQAGKIVPLGFGFHHQQIIHNPILCNLISQQKYICMSNLNKSFNTLLWAQFCNNCC
ncbi:hypothetical protein HanPI659440_Chr08g0309021 [Helianthus annuus]|nr:hypothetical protein HanPI659440_Chr08g0309021 [Helianthus annuus]